MHDDELIGEAIRRAGPPPEIPELVRTRIQRDVQAHWQASRRRRVAVPLALAVSLSLAVVLIWQLMAPSPVIATVASQSGAASADGVALHPGAELADPALIETGDGLVLTLEGSELRFDGGSRIAWTGTRELGLEQGAVFLDVSSGSWTVRTPHGEVRDVGTRFQVRSDADGDWVAVRSGTVLVTGEQGAELELPAGRAASYDGRGVGPSEQLPAWDASWGWVADLAEPFALDGSTLSDYLRYVSRECGYELRISDAATRLALRDVELRGDALDGDPCAQLDLVLSATRIAHRLDDGELFLRLRD